MKDNTSENKRPLNKSLAVTGLVIIVVFMAWAAVQIVQVLPNAISSLASLADSVYNHDPKKTEPLDLESDRNIINSGEVLTVTWNKERKSDKSFFTYECHEGISVDLRKGNSETKSLTCNNPYELDEVTQIELLINSEKDRFSDLAFSIDLYQKNSSSPDQTESQIITVVNPEIAGIAENDDSDTPVTEIENPTAKPENNHTETVTGGQAPIATQPEYTYVIPASNPNGNTDLVVSNIKVGVIGFGNTFIENDAILKNIDGAIQFTVHNIGNRTSEEWVFNTTLPGGSEYSSKDQEPLKPNERATITISHPIVFEDDLQNITVEVETDRDTNTANNELLKTVIVVQ